MDEDKIEVFITGEGWISFNILPFPYYRILTRSMIKSLTTFQMRPNLQKVYNQKALVSALPEARQAWKFFAYDCKVSLAPPPACILLRIGHPIGKSAIHLQILEDS